MSVGNFGNVNVGANGLVSFSGLESGVNTQLIIQALLTVYTDQINSYKSQQGALSTQVSDWQTINNDLASLQSAAHALNTPLDWQNMTTSSSNSSVATATAALGTPAGSVSFAVNSLATTDSWLSSGSVASTGTVVDTNSDYLISQASQYGFSSLASNGLTIGSHSVDVTQALSAASVTGSTLLSSTGNVTITAGSNDTFVATLNGVTNTYTIAAGTYSTSGSGAGSLVNAIDNASSTSGGTYSSDGGAAYVTGGYLTLATNTLGSATSIQVTGGNALPTLGIAAMGAANVGTAGSVSVDGTVTALNGTYTIGQVVALAAPTGSVTATLGTGVGDVSGTFTATDVATGSGSLSDVVSAINNANAGVTASAVQTGGGGYVLQLSSTSTGANAQITNDANAFAASGLGAMNQNQTAADSMITVGGAGGYAVTSQTNTITGLMPGLSVQLAATSAAPVTISISQNTAGLSSDVQTLVNAANQALTDLNTLGGYNATTKVAGPLAGQAGIPQLTQEILSTFASAAGTSGLGNAMAAGVTVNYSQSTGLTTIGFDSSTFQSELQSNPTAVEGLFAQGGTFTTGAGLAGGSVLFNSATDGTLPGAYAVNVTAVATQASNTGTQNGGTITSTETLQFTVGSTNVNYTTSNNESYAQVVQGLNAAFAAAGVSLGATVSGGFIQVSSTGYGSAQSFTIAGASGAAGSTGLANGTYTGTDVAGTINAVAATGSGQFLSAPSSDPTLAGLTLQVTATTVGNGTFTYTPGLAASLATVANAASSTAGGTVTQAIDALNNQSSTLGTQITFYQNLETSQQTLLQAEFSLVEARMGALKTESAYLASALGQLAGAGI